MDTREIIKSQYAAALEMLRQAIVQCPASLWDDRAYKNPFWHIVYHALFYTHLYLQPAEADLQPWAKHRAGYNRMGLLPGPPHTQPEIGESYTQQELLDYHALVCEQVKKQVAALDLDAVRLSAHAEAASGFYWLAFGKLELQFYNIRHIQQHTGELCERLGASGDVEIGWVGVKRDG